jgi:hypothetical protein
MAEKQISKPVQEKPAEAPLALGVKIDKGFLTELPAPKKEKKEKNEFIA